MTAARPLPIPAERLRFGCRSLTRPIRKRFIFARPFSRWIFSIPGAPIDDATSQLPGTGRRQSKDFDAATPGTRSFELFVLCATPAGPGMAPARAPGWSQAFEDWSKEYTERDDNQASSASPFRCGSQEDVRQDGRRRRCQVCGASCRLRLREAPRHRPSVGRTPR